MGLFVFAFLLYANTISNDYVLDDKIVILANVVTQKGMAAIPEIFTKSMASGFSGEQLGYRPFTLSTFALEYHFFGKNPHISHFINVVLYAITIVVLFFTLSMLFSRFHFIIPISMTLLFAAHPIHTEVVANIKSRDELIAFLGSIGAVYFLLKYLGSGKIILFAVSVLSFAAGLLSKENTVTFLGIIPLTLFFFTDLKIKKIFFFSLPFLFVWLLDVWLYLSMLGKFREFTLMDNSLVGAPNAAVKYATIILILGKNVLLLFFPHPLTYLHGYNHIPLVMMNNWKVILSLLMHLGLVIFSLYGFARKNFIAYGIFYYFITFSIYSNVVMLAPDPMADRFLYMASLGFCIAIPLVMSNGLEKFFSKSFHTNWLTGLLILILIPFSLKTFYRNKNWKNNLTLFSSDIKYLPDCATAHLFLGKVIFAEYFNTQISEEKNKIIKNATVEMNEALRIYPQYAEAWNALGTMSLKLGDAKHAMEYYDKALAINPQYAEVYYFKGNYYSDVQNYANAISNFELAIRYSPRYLDAYSRLGAVHFKVGDLSRATEYTMKAIEIDSTQAILYSNLGSIAMNQSEDEKAILNYQKAIQLDSNFYEAYLFISSAYDKIGNAEMKKYYAEKAAALKKDK